MEAVMNRRTALKSIAMGATALLPGPVAVWAQSPAVKLALVVPLSGPYAKQGDLMLKGAQFATDQINSGGGIAALGGAHIQLVVADAGDSVERAKSAAERLLSQESDLSGGTGAFLSSFTLAVTEATERAELPWITNSISDQIVNRGFKYVFQTSPPASRLAHEAIPTILKMAETATGKKPASIGLVVDNTAFAGSFAKPVRDGDLAPLKLVVDETITPPLADATSVVQKIRSARPDFLMVLLSATNDNKLLLEKLTEFDLGRDHLPAVAIGSQAGAPDLRTLMGNDLLEGLLVVVLNWGSKNTQAVSDEFKRRTKEPWMTQDSIDAYGAIYILKAAIESAKSADRHAVGQALHSIDLSDGPAKIFPGGNIKFDATGRMVSPGSMVLQWQNGEPVPVYPTAVAVAKPLWGSQ
jgi:branched-chain amino acid transport system substrate-binding protein